MQAKTQFIFDYSVEIDCLEDLQAQNPVSLKEALWLHVEKVRRC